MIYDVRHHTELVYEQLVTEAHHVLHLLPRTFGRQRCIAASLRVDPEPGKMSATEDYFGNLTHHLILQKPHRRLLLDAVSRVEVRPPEPPYDVAASTPWDTVAARLAKSEGAAISAQQYIFESPQIAIAREAHEYALPSFAPGRPILEAAMDLTIRIFDDFKYQGGVSDVSTPVTKVLELRAGVCQDFAHLMIACLRSFGLASRYVSGYLLTHPPPGQPKLVGSDASHAWVSVWDGVDAWVDFDPTNRLIPADEHITIGWGRDYSDVSPTSGFIVGGGEHEVKVSVDVGPVEAAQSAG